MKPHVSLITLAVDDLPRAAAFYRDGLGWPVRFANDDIIFLQLNGLLLGLFPKEQYARDVGVDTLADGAPPRVAFAHNVSSPEAVDAVLRDAEAAGGRIVKPARQAEWGGYSGYFADPDGFLWEIAHNPHMPDLAAE
ncbi:MAG: VOC family protein [Phycisphaeraceae bacterium]